MYLWYICGFVRSLPEGRSDQKKHKAARDENKPLQSITMTRSTTKITSIMSINNVLNPNSGMPGTSQCQVHTHRTYLCLVCDKVVRWERRSRHEESVKHQVAAGDTHTVRPARYLEKRFCHLCKSNVRASGWSRHARTIVHRARSAVESASKNTPPQAPRPNFS